AQTLRLYRASLAFNCDSQQIAHWRPSRSAYARSLLLDRTRKTAEAVATEPRLRPKSKSSMTTTMPLQARSARPAGILPLRLANCALHPRFVFSRALKRLSFLASFCQNCISRPSPLTARGREYPPSDSTRDGSHLSSLCRYPRINYRNLK